MINAVQGFDLLHSGFQSGFGSVVGLASEYRAARAHAATVQGYNNLVERYNELLTTSTHVTERLKKALDRERAESERLRRLLKNQQL